MSEEKLFLTKPDDRFSPLEGVSNFYVSNSDLSYLQSKFTAPTSRLNPAYTPLKQTSQYAMTQDEVAEVLGVTRQRVQQIEKSALEKLRKIIDEDPNFNVDDWLI